jgi:RNA polymerase sigma-70 factor (ECF subfamily)
VPNSPDPDLPERALVILARSGDDTAFGELVRRRQGTVRGLLRRLTGDAALGDDLAQDAFVRAWQTLGQLREPHAFGSWMRQLAVNVWLQHARRARVPLDFVPGDELEAAGEADPAGALGCRLDVDGALSRLRAPERLCVILAYGEGMSHGEIAQTTQLPLGTVKSHLSRGLTKLRQRMRHLQATEPRSAS